ncbi:hypothetical protein GCM10022221_48880 [Actinocorallia aurea]
MILVFDAFDGPAPLTLTQIARRCGLPRSSVHRILDQLVSVGWVARQEDRYRLGLRMAELGARAQHQNAVRQAALPLMRELHAATGHAVRLSVLDGADLVTLELLGVPADPRAVRPTEGRIAAHCTAAGKVLLAYASEEAVKEAIAHGLRARTSFSITDGARLTAELQQARERGAAFDREESRRGLACVAAPVRGPGAPVAALSVCVPARRTDLVPLVSAVRATAARVWAATGGAPAVRHEGQGDWPLGALDSWSMWPRLTDWF